jgi:lipoyl(octanoyl) transferase
MPSLNWSWLGTVGYGQAVALQERIRQAVLEGGPEHLLLVEHPPVVTLGRSAKPEHLLQPDELSRRGIAVERSTRGGQVTYHGPGQLMAYPVMRLSRGVLAHVEALCAAAIAIARSLGVEAHFRRDCPGVWVEKERKLASVGVHIHRRVSVHGLSLNVASELEPFQWIVACGLSGSRPTSLALECGGQPTVKETASQFAVAFARAVGREPLLSAPPTVE